MAKHWSEVQCQLRPDKTGVLWDMVLYVPTVGFLLLWGLKLWYAGGEQAWIGYGLMFLGFFFLMVGGGRIMRRLLLLPSAPVALDINRERVRLSLKNGEAIALVKGIKFFTDYAGKSFGLTGTDNRGAERQFVFHRQQFDEALYADVIKALEIYK
ncbi:MAG TPA: hypothetical protein VNI58_01005 [Mariprofundaceae bacterium]|nr:hypothetical protein [Mariprofundaceae bacterium]